MHASERAGRDTSVHIASSIDCARSGLSLERRSGAGMDRVRALQLLLALAFASWPYAQCKIKFPWVTGVAHASFYGGEDAGDTNLCGYGNVFHTGYGTATVSVSSPLFRKGETCGACYQLRCAGGGCYPGFPKVLVTATNFCPEGSYGGLCNERKVHFDLSEPAFTRLADYDTPLVPVDYRRVRCNTPGGIMFQINGKPFVNIILVHNVGGVGDVKAVFLRTAGNRVWKPLKRNFGQNWENNDDLRGQVLSLKVVTSDDRFCISPDVVPATWEFGQTYEGRQLR